MQERPQANDIGIAIIGDEIKFQLFVLHNKIADSAEEVAK